MTLRVRNMVRRMAISATRSALWVLEGHEDSEGNVEEDAVEVFSGVGFYSRPADGANAEAVIVKVGGESGHPVIVATRDQDALAALAAAGVELGADETVVFNRMVMLWLRADGSVLVGTPGGTFKALATADHKHSLSGVTYGGDPATGTMGASDTNTTDLRAT